MEDMTKPISDVLAEADFGPQLLTQELDTSSIQHEYNLKPNTQGPTIVDQPLKDHKHMTHQIESEQGHYNSSQSSSINTTGSSSFWSSFLGEFDALLPTSQSSSVLDSHTTHTEVSLTSPSPSLHVSQARFTSPLSSQACDVSGSISGLASVVQSPSDVTVRDTSRLTVRLADINRLNTSRSVSTLFEKLHQQYDLQLSHLNMYLAANKIVASSLKNPLDCRDELHQNISRNSSKNMSSLPATSVDKLPSKLSVPHQNHSLLEKTVVSSTSVLRYSSNNGTYSVASPCSDRPMLFEPLNPKDVKTNDGQEKAKTSEKAQVVQEYSEEESMSDTEVEPEPSSKLRDFLCTGQITAKERVHNLCTEYPATVNRMLESETEMGALLSRKQDVNVKDLITTQSMLPGYSGERTFENTVSYSDQLARPPLNQVSRAGVSRSTEEHWSQMKACEGAKTKLLPCVSESFCSVRGTTSTSDNMAAGKRPPASQNMNVDLQNLERMTNLLPCRPNMSFVAPKCDVNGLPQKNTNNNQLTVFTKCEKNYLNQTGGSSRINLTKEQLHYDLSGQSPTTSVQSSHGPWLNWKSCDSPYTSEHQVNPSETTHKLIPDKEHIYTNTKTNVDYTGQSNIVTTAKYSRNAGQKQTNLQKKVLCESENSKVIVEQKPEINCTTNINTYNTTHVARGDVTVLGKIEDSRFVSPCNKSEMTESKCVRVPEEEQLLAPRVPVTSFTCVSKPNESESNNKTPLTDKWKSKKSEARGKVTAPSDSGISALQVNTSLEHVNHAKQAYATAAGIASRSVTGGLGDAQIVETWSRAADINANHQCFSHNLTLPSHGPQVYCHHWNECKGNTSIADHTQKCKNIQGAMTGTRRGRIREEDKGQIVSKQNAITSKLADVAMDIQPQNPDGKDQNHLKSVQKNILERAEDQSETVEVKKSSKSKSSEKQKQLKHATDESPFSFIDYSDMNIDGDNAGTQWSKKKHKVKRKHKLLIDADCEDNTLYKCYTECPPVTEGSLANETTSNGENRKYGKIKCVISKQVLGNSPTSCSVKTKKCNVVKDQYDSKLQDSQLEQNPEINSEVNRTEKPWNVVSSSVEDNLKVTECLGKMNFLDRKKMEELQEKALSKKCSVSLYRLKASDWNQWKEERRNVAETGFPRKEPYCTSEKEHGQSHNVNTQRNRNKVDHFNKKEWSGHTKKRKSSSAVNPSSPGRQVESKEHASKITREQKTDNVPVKVKKNISESQLLSEDNWESANTQKSRRKRKDNSSENNDMTELERRQKVENNSLEICKERTICPSPIMTTSTNFAEEQRLSCCEETPDCVYEGVSEDFLLEQIGESERLTQTETFAAIEDIEKQELHKNSVQPLPVTSNDFNNSNKENLQVASHSGLLSEMNVSHLDKSSDPESDLILITPNMRKRRKNSSKGSVSSSSSDKGHGSGGSKNNGFLKVILKKPRLVVDNTPLPSPTSSTNSAILSESSTDVKSFLPEPFAEHKPVYGGHTATSPFMSSSTEDTYEDSPTFGKSLCLPKLVVQQAEENVLSTRSGRLVKRSTPEIKETILESSFASVVLLGKQFEFSTGRVSANQCYSDREGSLNSQNMPVHQSVGPKRSTKGQRSKKIRAQNGVKGPNTIDNGSSASGSVPGTSNVKPMSTCYKLPNGQTVAAGNGFSWDSPMDSHTSSDISSEKLNIDGTEMTERNEKVLNSSSISPKSIISEHCDKDSGELNADHVFASNDVIPDKHSSSQYACASPSEASNVGHPNANLIDVKPLLDGEKSTTTCKRKRKQSASYSKRRKHKSKKNKFSGALGKELRIHIHRINSVTETSDYVISFIDSVTAKLKPKISHQIPPAENSGKSSDNNSSISLVCDPAAEQHKVQEKNQENPSITTPSQKAQNFDQDIKNGLPTLGKVRNLFSDIRDITTLSKDLENHSINDENMVAEKNIPSLLPSTHNSANCSTEEVTSKFLDISSGPDDESGDEAPIVEHHVYPQPRNLHSPSKIRNNPFAPKNWSHATSFPESRELCLERVLSSDMDHDWGNDADTETDTEAEKQNSQINRNKQNAKKSNKGVQYLDNNSENKPNSTMCVTAECMKEVTENNKQLSEGACSDKGDEHNTCNLDFAGVGKEELGNQVQKSNNKNEKVSNTSQPIKRNGLHAAEDKDIGIMQNMYNTASDAETDIKDERQNLEENVQNKVNKVDANQNEKHMSVSLCKLAADTVLQLKDVILPPTSTPCSKDSIETKQNSESEDTKAALIDTPKSKGIGIPWSHCTATLNSPVHKHLHTGDSVKKLDTFEENVIDLCLSDTCSESDNKAQQPRNFALSYHTVDKNVASISQSDQCISEKQSYCEPSGKPSRESWHIVDEKQECQRTNEALLNFTHSCEDNMKKVTSKTSCDSDAFNFSKVNVPCNDTLSDMTNVRNTDICAESALDLSQKSTRSELQDGNCMSLNSSENSFSFPIIDNKMAEKATNVIKSVKEVEMMVAMSNSSNVHVKGNRTDQVLADLERQKDLVDNSNKEGSSNDDEKTELSTHSVAHVSKYDEHTTDLKMHKKLCKMSTGDSQEMVDQMEFIEKKQVGQNSATQHQESSRIGTNTDTVVSNDLTNNKSSPTIIVTDSVTDIVKHENSAYSNKAGPFSRNKAQEHLPHTAHLAFNSFCSKESGNSGQKDLCKLVGVVSPRQFRIDDHDSSSSKDLSSEEDADDPMMEQMIFAHDLLTSAEKGTAFKCLLCSGEHFSSMVSVIQHILQLHCYCHLCSQGYPEVYAYQGHIWSQHADDEELIRNARKLAKFRSSNNSHIPTPPKLRQCYAQCDNTSSVYSCKLCGKTADNIPKARSHVAKYHFKKAYWLIKRRKRSVENVDNEISQK